jgi:hypothetical protein
VCERQAGDDDLAVGGGPCGVGRLDPSGGTGVADLEHPVDDGRHRRVGRDQRDAADVAAFESTAHRSGARTQQRRCIEHDQRPAHAVRGAVDLLHRLASAVLSSARPRTVGGARAAAS